VPNRHQNPESDIEGVNDRLQDAITVCRSVVTNYRLLLTGEDHARDLSAEVSAGGQMQTFGPADACASPKPSNRNTP
jgi:hypothetical protein